MTCALHDTLANFTFFSLQILYYLFVSAEAHAVLLDELLVEAHEIFFLFDELLIPAP